MLKNLISMLSLLIFSGLVFANQTVQVLWPFSVSSSQANMLRTIIDEANIQQSKYKFVFVSRPGAGGSVAANAVVDSRQLTILASTSSFYIRPMLYKDSHQIDDFTPVSTFCSSQPLAVYSKKVNKISQGNNFTVGVIPGSITALVTRAINRENTNMKIIEVPYKGTPEATTDMLGGHIDASVDFIGVSILSRFNKDVNVLGITGKRSINGYPTFQMLGINGLENVTNDYYFFVNKSVESQVRIELNRILNNAISDRTKSICEEDYGQIVKMEINAAELMHEANKKKWISATRGIDKE